MPGGEATTIVYRFYGDDGDRQMLTVLAALLTDGLPGVDAALSTAE